MKKFFYTFLLFFTLCLGEGFACHLSGIALSSGPTEVADANGDGDTDYSITIALSVTCGAGAVNSTEDFWFTFTGAGTVIMAPSSLTIGGDAATGTTSGQTVNYNVCSNNNCSFCPNGGTATYTILVVFVVDDYPSSLTVYGLEQECNDGVCIGDGDGSFCINDYTPADATPEVINFTPLPIILGDFNGKALNGYNKLEWNVKSGYNVKNLALQKAVKSGLSHSHSSSNHFDMWKTIEIIAINGENINNKSFESIDVNPDNNNYYRVLNEDLDGVINFSSILSVVNSFEKEVLVNLINNPVNDKLKIAVKNFEENFFDFVIFDYTGKIIKQSTERFISSDNQGNSISEIDVRDLLNGMYLISFQLNGVATSQKFVKN